jgi:hypothetical protein
MKIQTLALILALFVVGILVMACARQAPPRLPAGGNGGGNTAGNPTPPGGQPGASPSPSVAPGGNTGGNGATGDDILADPEQITDPGDPTVLGDSDTPTDPLQG